MRRAALVLAGLVLSAVALAGQNVDPSTFATPPTTSWPTFNGDYSGRRFSPLKTLTDANVKALSLAWLYPLPANGGAPIKSTPLQVDGVLYFSTPDHA